MPQYIARRAINYREGILEAGKPIPDGLFDRQKMGQLIRIRWVRETTDPDDPNDRRVYTDDGLIAPVDPTPRTANEIVTLAKTTGDEGLLEDTTLEGKSLDVDPSDDLVDDDPSDPDAAVSTSTETLEPAVDDPKLGDTGLTDRQQQALLDAGYTDRLKLDAASDEELLKVPGIGDRALARIRGR